MPSVTIELPDIEQTVVRPTVYQVVNQVIDILDITGNPEILYAGKRGVIQTPGSAIEETGKVNEAKFSSDNLFFIEVIEKYDEEAVQEIQSHSFDNIPIFVDRQLDLSLRPIYTPSKMEITIRFRHTSETDVRRWLSKMIIKTSRGRDINLHHIAYKYPLPFEFLFLLMEIYNKRESVEGYGDSFRDYFNKHRAGRFTYLTDQAGENEHLAIIEKQGQIVGQFDFTVVSEKPEFIKDKGVWEGQFVYNYTYWRPDAMYVNYPLSVHNQFLSEEFWKHVEQVEDYQTHRHAYSHSYNALQIFSLDEAAKHVRKPERTIRIPAIDDFDPEVKKHTATIFTALCFLDEGKRDLLSLADLGDYVIDEDILEFLKEEHSYLTRMFYSIFHVEHYVNGKLQLQDTLEVTPDLMIRSKQSLSMRDRHHVRLCALPEINQPLYQALMRVARHPRAFVKIVGAMNELLALDPDFGSLSDYTEIKPWMFTSVYRILNMVHQGNFYSTGTNIDGYIHDLIFNDHNALGLLRSLDPKLVKDYFERKRRKQVTVMNAFVVAKPRSALTEN